MQESGTEALIRNLCRALATLEHPTRWDEFPPAAQVDWPDLFELANRFWLGPALAHAVVRHPLRIADSDDSLGGYCRWLIEGSERRHAALEDELMRLVAFLNERSIEPLLFKGSAELWSEPADLRGRRFMMDLDVLLPPETVGSAWRALRERGYQEIEPGDLSPWPEAREEKHAPALVGPGGVTVELHRRLLNGGDPLRMLAADAREPVAAPEFDPPLRAWQLTSSGKVAQAIAHDLLDHHHYRDRSLDLRYSYHIYLLVTAAGGRVDWSVIERAFTRHPEELAAARQLLIWFWPDAPATTHIPGAATSRWLAESIARLDTPRETLREHANGRFWRAGLANTFAVPDGAGLSFGERSKLLAHRIRRRVRQLIHPRSKLSEARRRAEAKALQHHPRLIGDFEDGGEIGGTRFLKRTSEAAGEMHNTREKPP